VLDDGVIQDRVLTPRFIGLCCGLLAYFLVTRLLPGHRHRRLPGRRRGGPHGPAGWLPLLCGGLGRSPAGDRTAARIDRRRGQIGQQSHLRDLPGGAP